MCVYINMYFIYNIYKKIYMAQIPKYPYIVEYMEYNSAKKRYKCWHLQKHGEM